MSKEKDNVKTYKFNCYKCGKVHGINECPAYNRICNTCGNKNHFALMCKNKAKSENRNYEKRENNQVNTVEKENEVYEYLCLDEVEIGTSNTWTDNVKINELNVKIKLDTGAQLNVMSIEMYKKIKSAQLEKCEVVIKTFGRFTMKSQGKINVEIENDKCKTNVVYEIVNYERMPVLGLKDCKTLKYKFNEVHELEIENKKKTF